MGFKIGLLVIWRRMETVLKGAVINESATGTITLNEILRALSR